MKKLSLLMCAAATLSISLTASGEWKMKQGQLMTRWAAQVDPKAPLPEYPRPQLVRADWLNLNGVWEYQPGKADDATPVGQKLSSEILVPFPVESAISGVMEHHDRIWYRRSFEVPAAWNGKRVVLHFGAVDYESEVFINGKSAGTHKGGYLPFSFDITPLLTGTGPQEIIVRVFDPTNDGGQPRGKQSLRPGGIMYTPTTGIWQTVWLEPVAEGGVDSLKIVPDVDGGQVKVTVNALGSASSPVTVTVKDGDATVATARGAAGSELAIKVPDAKLWSPDSPHLYDLAVSVAGADDRSIDTVTSYFGMRKVSIGEENGVKKMFLNGKFLWQLGPLDQGFWPDGIYTQPTEEALKYDIQVTKDLGFNMIRKHIKVEPARWYYWCDKIGLVVWQDMPSANSYTGRGDVVPPVDKPEYEKELTEMVQALYNVPSIIMWDVYNEGQGQFDTPRLVAKVKELDPTRLVNQASGGNHEGAGDVFDIHSYPPPNVPRPNRNMALACGEYGGIAFRVPGHMWVDRGGGYIDAASPQDLVDMYAEFTQMLKKFRDENGLSAAVYTQTTDVETEINGLLTYDRVPKADVAQFAKANRFELTGPKYTPIVATSQKESQEWKYTTERPGGNWNKADFDDSGWKTGKGGFGTANTPNIGQLGTEWNTSDIWLRRTFTLKNVKPEQVDALLLSMYHDEDAQVFINGVPAGQARGFAARYESRPLREPARKALKLDGENVIAVHCHQTEGGQYIDVGIQLRESTTP
ncbi:MAG: glycoside hydrolase family 2 TIM barrel-domain containing protein [Tepidisphaeraceae bacterium]